MQEINIIDHPFKQEMFYRVKDEYQDFDYHYFDNPQTLTGFRGFTPDGNPAEGSRDFAAEARTIAALPGVGTVLDVGCAKGYLVRALRRLGLEARGIDVSCYAIGQADEEVRPHLRCLRVQDLEPSETYDLVHTSGVLIYLTLSEIREVLRRFHQMSRVGVMIDEPTRERILGWYEARDVTGLDPFRKQELSRVEWEMLIEDAGFTKSGLLFQKKVR
jgi:2-polyprenyl-3-methyl-5-hydroxy-6-metoxy-1,4-benzoquinol methylase